jgi:glycerophosphoryl diester phosphodiesterase
VIELDVHLTKDGQVVVSHDNNLKRLAGVDKLISEVNYEVCIFIWFISFHTPRFEIKQKKQQLKKDLPQLNEEHQDEELLLNREFSYKQIILKQIQMSQSI